MVSIRARVASSMGSSRMPIDADGHHGMYATRSAVEPEIEIDGRMVLVGKPVKTILDVDADDQEDNNKDASQRSEETTRVNEKIETREPALEYAGKDGCGWTLFASDIVQTVDSADNCNAPSIQADSNGVASNVGQLTTSVNSSPPKETDSAVIDLTQTEDANGATQEAVPKPASAPAATVESSSFGWARMFNWGSPGPSSAPEKGDDESTVDGRLFGELSSLPSVNGDVTIDGNSIQSTDFDGRDDQSQLRQGVDKKVQEIIVNKEAPLRTEHSGVANNGCRRSSAEELSANNRRQLLIKELRSAIATNGRYDLRCANISAALGDLLNETAEHEQAVKLHQDAVSIYSVKLGDNHATTIDAKVRLAKVLSDARQFNEAIATYYNVIAMRRALKGEKDPSVAEGIALMADCLKQSGEYAQAIKELKRALKIFRESLGDSNELVSKTVDEIASLYITLGDFEKSAAILEEVVKLKAATQGTQSKAVAETLISLAMTHECSEQFTEAMKSLKKAYKIYTEIGGYSSEDATATLKKIALLYEAMKDYNRASIAFLGVLRGQKIILGEEHLQVGETYCNLGHALRHTNQFDKALKCMKEALPIFVGQGVEMQDVEKIAEIMHEMALIYKEKKHFNEAARIFKQELSVRRKIGQPEYPCIARTLNLLGLVEHEMRNNSRALKFLVESLSIYQQERNGMGIECAQVLFNTGLVFNSVRNSNRAREAFTESLRIFKEQGLANDDPLILQTEKEIAKLRENLSTRRAR